MTPKQQYYNNVANTVIKHFSKRKIEGYYCPTSKDAVEKIIEIIQEGSTVAWGGSMTLNEIGLFDELDNTNKYSLIDKRTAKSRDEAEKLYHEAFNADYYLMSSNAITLDGELINIDGNGNRVAALIYGPKNVIVVAGINKIVTDEDTGIKRVRNMSAPPNTSRLNLTTPCVQTGKCHDCLSDECICCQTVITRMSRKPNRIKVILVGEELGY
jgi:L-lactate utilization protein LutB